MLVGEVIFYYLYTMKHLSSYLLALVGAGLFAVSCTGCSNDDNTPVKPTPKPTPVVDSVVPEPEEVIMYEANPRLYGSSECLKGLEQHLEDIKALGTNVLWLMPICEYGIEKGIGSPYCIKDYTKVEPKYGTLDDLRSVVKRAHELEMAVIIDWVANHTSWDSAWISNKDWYTQDGAGNIISPAGTGWNDVADLNFDNRAMRHAMIDAMKYWVEEADIDGYRCDAADWVPADFWAEAIAALRGAFPEKEILMLAEGAEMSNFEAGFDMNYAWNYYDTLESVFKGQSADKIFKTHESEYAAIPEGAVKLRFTTNHDKTAYNGTPIEIYGGREGSLAALTITTLMGGAPMLYASQECAQSTALDFMKYFDYDWAKDLDYTAKVKQIMAIRKDNKIFSKSRIQDFSGSHYVMFYRLDYPAEALVLVNVRNSEQLVTIPSAHAGKTMTDALTSESINLPEEITLGAYECKIWIK